MGTNAIYIIQMLVRGVQQFGFRQRKPTWKRVFAGNRSAIGKETAWQVAQELRAKNPGREYRVRKLRRR
jgi:hypothetical protein